MSWGFSQAELNVAVKVLDAIAADPALLEEPVIVRSGIAAHLNGGASRPSMGAGAKPIPGAPGSAGRTNPMGRSSPSMRSTSPTMRSTSPTQRASAQGADLFNNRPRASSPTAMLARGSATGSDLYQARPSSPTAQARSAPQWAQETKLVSNEETKGPSGSQKYTSGGSFKRTVCASHKYGGGGN
eukprot:CAMPEP_0174286818 /NCGR_PEP_ID=MMETSP0809-20121228/13164_1 /TAXON_ID=73025 ORGANISM="Eutreptiella gymnastica-like, Strain CCMP1594" /NCGR_SAMPLE_ID=MMETSP0809 /ASSEMBLY_ACC=CAM_ASM_000658 /LENGTH=184 /DNA_ID=CAMNT_0015383033 /DNA_START=28 /DNA_END=582 /DNA_ORIENTATION=+